MTRTPRLGEEPVMAVLAPTVPEFLDLLRRNMQRRGDSATDIVKRLASAEREIEFMKTNRELFAMIFEVVDVSSAGEIVPGLVSL